MNVSDSVLTIILVLLGVLLAVVLPVLIWRMRHAARHKPAAAPPLEPPINHAATTSTLSIPPEELSGQTGGALMQDYSALQSEYRRVDGQRDAAPAPRKNGKSH